MSENVSRCVARAVGVSIMAVNYVDMEVGGRWKVIGDGIFDVISRCITHTSWTLVNTTCGVDLLAINIY